MSLSIGDIVHVNKDDAGITLSGRAEVIQMPQGQGDVWGFKDLATGHEIYTNETFTAYKREGVTKP